MFTSMKIYISGAYSAPTEEERLANVYAAIDAAVAILDNTGYSVFVPHLSHFMDKRHPMPYRVWLSHDLVWLDACDALLLLGHSNGADMELQYAIQKHKRVFYSVQEVIDDYNNGQARATTDGGAITETLPCC